ncbi:MAG: leucine-rich repeat domain-containing protein, partial [Tannerellaceae bacterium]|nr:leucine-rich repeat domain-containing protein [Tannerellaceae bacterium]
FADCTGLLTITLPNSVTSIENSAFYGCIRLQSITIPNSVISIGSSAFNECTLLQSVILPSSVTSIGDWAFSECKNLRSVTVQRATPPNIGNAAFTFVPLSSATLTVPIGSRDAYASSPTWRDFGTIIEQ